MKLGVNLYPSVGGSGHVATRLGQHLAERGHEIHYITYKRPSSVMWEQKRGEYVDLVDKFDYPLFEDIGAPYTVALCSKIVKVCRASGLDLIHSHYAIPHAMAALVAREITGTPYMVTLHGSDVHTLGIDPAYKPVVQHTIEEANAVTAVSEFLKRSAIDGLEIHREIEVIPNFIDVGRFRHMDGTKFVVANGCVSVEHQEKKTISPDEKVLLHVSNFRKVKRVVELIEIMKKVVDELPNTRLVIAGDGPARIEVERKIEELNLCGKVYLLGVRSNMQELMCSADAFLLNSTLEGMPLVLLEAMACRLPVVTTPAGGVPELVRPGIDGVVTKGFDSAEFSEEVIRLLADDALRTKFAFAGRRRVEEKFSAQRIVPLYETVFEKAVSN